jgi:hypothetical protein
MNVTLKTLLFFLICPALLLAQNRPNSLPAGLGALKLVRSMTGEEARSFLNRLHAKADAPKSSLAGEYSAMDNQATLYISVYKIPSDASAASRQMAARIKAGNPVFGHYEETNNRGLKISRCLGLGQVHFFFRYRERLLWLAVDPPAASQALDALINAVTSNTP